MRPNRTQFAAWLALLILGLGVTFAASPQEEPPEDPVAAPSEPRWFKGNLHTHSLWSDGNDYPEMIVDWYARRGSQFLALSDHNTLSQGPRRMTVKEADARAKQEGFGRDRKRFGDAWVETRTEKGEEQVGSSRWASSGTCSSGRADSC